jgi:hypothetical protein
MKIPIPSGATEVEVTFPAVEPPPNEVPIVNAGANQTVTLPTNSVSLKGSATDPDGTIAAYVWERLSGSGTITTPNAATTTIAGLTAGSSVFRLTAVDNNGASVSDDVSIIVNASTPPPTPGYELIYENPFEQDSDIRNSQTQQAGKGIIDKTFFKEGSGSFLTIPENVSAGIRSEIQGFPTPTEGAMEWWVYYKVIIPHSGCSFQFHPNTPGSSGSPFLAHENGKFVWENWKAGGNTPHPTNTAIPSNKWVKMRVEYKAGSSGYFRHFLDSVKICEWNGQVGDGSGFYAKCGVNFWTTEALNSRVFYDSLKVWKKV